MAAFRDSQTPLLCLVILGLHIQLFDLFVDQSAPFHFFRFWIFRRFRWLFGLLGFWLSVFIKCKLRKLIIKRTLLLLPFSLLLLLLLYLGGDFFSSGGLYETPLSRIPRTSTPFWIISSRVPLESPGPPNSSSSLFESLLFLFEQQVSLLS